MKRILCYGDSNTWGCDPENRNAATGFLRYPPHVRWTGVMQDILGAEYTVIEEGNNGRTTVFDDPGCEGRNGLAHLEMIFYSQEPLELIIFMLGTNDTKDMFASDAAQITKGMDRLIRKTQGLLPYSISQDAKLLIVSPVSIERAWDGSFWYGLSKRSAETAAKLAETYRALAAMRGCEYMNAAEYARPGAYDGVHIDPVGHKALGAAMANRVKALLE